MYSAAPTYVSRGAATATEALLEIARRIGGLAAIVAVLTRSKRARGHHNAGGGVRPREPHGTAFSSGDAAAAERHQGPAHTARSCGGSAPLRRDGCRRSPHQRGHLIEPSGEVSFLNAELLRRGGSA